MTLSGKTENLEIAKLLGADASGLAQTISENPMLLDRLVSALADIRNAATENAKTRFRLTKSFWPNFETGRPKSACVTWVARDTKNHRDIEVVYDFGKREYTVKEQSEGLEPEEVKETLAMVYLILPASELKMISIMQGRYEALATNDDIKRVSGRRR